MTFEEHAASPLSGGLVQHGYQCGMIWGSTLSAGAQAFKKYGPGAKAEAIAIKAGRQIVESFLKLNNTFNCMEITDLTESSSNMDMFIYFFLKGGTVGCMKMAAKYSPIAYREIKKVLSEEPPDSPPSEPVSCASLLMKKLGASDQHCTMASGFAGGIGLCGGACGALGAAIWYIGMQKSAAKNGKVDYKEPESLEAIERFLKASDYEFECADIVGRKFKDVQDHATFIQSGGCSEIIETLLETLQEQNISDL